ncbi:MAG: Endoribonuclease YbeY, partial [Actinomycetota bacterium]
LKKYVKQMLNYLDVNTNSDVSILFANEEEMAQLHLRWMKEVGPTDVMSFPMDDVLLHDKKARAKKAILGDIIVCPGVALKDAKSESTNPAFHLVFLIAHGILHLLGQDHQEDSQRGLMQKKEQGIMNSLRVSKKHL